MEENRKLLSFFAALLQTFANGFFYGYAIFSTRLKNLVGISSADVVLLGVLSQTGLGVLQYHTTLLVSHAQKRGVSMDLLDTIQSLFCGFLFCSAMCVFGAVVYLNEIGANISTSTSFAIMGACFFFWGQATGNSFNACSTVVNFNNAGHIGRKRFQLVCLSLSVGLGGVFIVVLYHFLLQDNTSLSAFLFGLAFFYFAVMLVRVRWMVRVREKEDAVLPAEDVSVIDDNGEPTTPPPVIPIPIERITPLPLLTLLRNDIVLLTCLGTFIGVGTGATFLSSLGNLGSQLVSDSDLTFSLTLTFLVSQTIGRLVNAIAYGLGDWPYIFAFWQAFCLFGVAAFLISPTSTGAFVSSAFVGMSFGGFHSSFPILAATSFPGNPIVDYSQSFGIALAVSSIGCIVIGQLTTVVYKSASLADLRTTGFFGTFLFFVALLVVSTVSAVVLGRKIRRNRDKVAHVTLRPDADGTSTVIPLERVESSDLLHVDQESSSSVT